MAYKVKGLDNVMRNLNREIKAIEGRSREGLLQAALFVESEAVPITPILTGTLRNSAFTDITAPGQTPPIARVGYSAEYAAAVHEMPEEYNYTSPGTGPKFLQRAISENVQEILGIIRRAAHIPEGRGDAS